MTPFYFECGADEPSNDAAGQFLPAGEELRGLPLRQTLPHCSSREVQQHATIDIAIVWTFNARANPLGARLNAISATDMIEVIPEACEMVEDGRTSADFSRFHRREAPVRLLTARTLVPACCRS